MAKKNVKRFLLLFALGIAYGFMYVMPYMKSSFYDQMIAAMGCTNEQLGSLMTYYCIACTISYLPGGWIGDKFNPKPVLLFSIFGQAVLSFLFMFTYQSYAMAVIIWILMGFTGGFAFWPAIMKGIRMTGSDDEQGRLYGIFEALNGVASLLLSFIMIGVMAVVGSAELVTGFKSALAFMGGLSVVSGILVLILMDKDAAYGLSETEKKKKITVQDYFHAFKIPGVWIMAILVWCYVTISAVASYLTPYSTNVLGMSAALAASIGTLRTYGCRLIGGPLGGYLADKAFKSVSKEQALGQAACVVTLGLFLVLPTGTSGAFLVVLLLLVGVAMFLCKGTYFSIQPEMGIPTHVSATAVAIATFVGYLPDMFTHTMFGKWIDTYGNGGYNRIIIYGVLTGVLGLAAAIWAVIESKRVAKRAAAAQEA
ncbi:MAG: MFS transporter [Oscillospiraceae bacterium]|nr:MFS transporter [Oscillospiraceae bacterium]